MGIRAVINIFDEKQACIMKVRINGLNDKFTEIRAEMTPNVRGSLTVNELISGLGNLKKSFLTWIKDIEDKYNRMIILNMFIKKGGI